MSHSISSRVIRCRAFAQNGDVRIAYELTGSGPPLVLLHGFGERGQSWHSKGMVEALAQDRGLVLIDARGHGDSNKPHTAESYQLEHLVSDVVAVLDHAGIEKADLLGYSQGGWIALGLAAFARDRVGKLVIGGATPYGQDLSLYRGLAANDARKALELIVSFAGTGLPAEASATFLANDMAALAAAYAVDRPDISGALHGLEKRCLLICGERDPLLGDMQRLAGEINNGQLLVMPDMNHIQAALRLAEMAPRIRAFLDAP